MTPEELSEFNNRRIKIIDIEGCARCGGNHKNVTIYKFGNPIDDSDGTIWSYWTLCPQTKEPVLVKVVER